MASQSAEMSIMQFMGQNWEKREGFVKSLYREWKDVLTQLEIPRAIRQKFDNWFQRCYKERENIRNSAKTLHEEFLREEGQFQEDFLLRQDLAEIKRYGDTEWVQKAIDCVRVEKELLQKHNEIDRQMINHKHLQEMESICDKVRELHKEIEQYLDRAEKDSEELIKKENNKHDTKIQLCDLKEVIKRKKEENGKILHQHQLETALETCNTQIRTLTKDLEEYKEMLKMKFCEITHYLETLVPRLIQEVKEWKSQYKLKFAELGPNPSIENIETWCADIGLILNELHYGRIQKWQNLLQTTSTHHVSQSVQIAQKVDHQRIQLTTETFLVTDQDDFIVKTDKKHLPKIQVRIMALDKIQPLGVVINAYFVGEDDFNSCYNEGNLDLSHLQDVSHSINQSSLSLCATKKSSRKFAVTFDKMAFKGQFSRKGQEKKPYVHEEKYRVVFHTKIEEHDMLILSLPMVVTTGANQGCNALASIMWQCFSTDVFAFPIQNRPTLPWSEVARMLKAKFSKLSDVRNLSPENIKHLKRRLLGSDQMPDDTEVSLNRFCFDKLSKGGRSEEFHSFSFWKWFLANYNLLDKYLKQYWEGDLIGGFLSKDDVEQMFKLEKNKLKKGTFILRFSDNHINDSQGVHSVFGYLTGMVTNSCEESGEKNYKVHMTEVADYKKLNDKNLANILKESLSKGGRGQVYKWLFPGDRSREEYFDKYCKDGTVVSGYHGKVDAFIVDLEQDMCALKIQTGKHRRSSIDSGFGAMSPQSVGSVKKVKSSTDHHPTIVNLLSTSNMGSPSNQSMMSTPQASPYTHDGSMSPAWPQPTYDPVSPSPPQSLQSQLPIMLQEGNGAVCNGAVVNGDHSNHGTHGNPYETISSDGLRGVCMESLKQNHQLQLAYAASNRSLPPQSPETNFQFGNYPELPPGSRVVVESSIPPDYTRMNGITSNPQGAIPGLHCEYVQHFIEQSTPEDLKNLLFRIFSQLPAEKINEIQQNMLSTHPSPAHPTTEMDNTPIDFVGVYFNDEIPLSTSDIAMGGQVNSGNMDLSHLVPNDQETL